MNDEEIGELLGHIALVDNREVGDGNIMAWADLLPPEITLADAKAAVREHRLTNFGVYLEPGHIIEGVRTIRRARLDRAGTPPMPGDLSLAEERTWRVLWCDAVKAGLDSGDAARAASEQLGVPPEVPASPETREAGLHAVRELAARWSMPRDETAARRDRGSGDPLTSRERVVAAVEDAAYESSAGRRVVLARTTDRTVYEWPVDDAAAVLRAADRVHWTRGVEGWDLRVYAALGGGIVECQVTRPTGERTSA